MLIALILSVLKKKDADVAEYESEYGSPLKTDHSSMAINRCMQQNAKHKTKIIGNRDIEYMRQRGPCLRHGRLSTTCTKSDVPDDSNIFVYVSKKWIHYDSDK